MALLALGGFNTSVATRVPLPSHGIISKPFSKRILKAHRPLLTISGISLEGTHGIS